MFDYFNGILTDKIFCDSPTATIDISGVGYYFFISQKDFNNLPDINSPCKIFAHLIHKEDSMTLYGFLEKESREIFKTLISVSGVGPKMGMQILNAFNPSELSVIVSSGDYKSLTQSKGVGPKLAQKIILELKDKFKDVIIDATTPSNHTSQTIDEAKNVLSSFGYEAEEIKKAIEYAMQYVKPNDETEEILKFALKYLSE